MPAVAGRVYGRQSVRSALLSARLFADALEDPYLRYTGIGTVPIERALDVLIADGGADHPVTAWMTRYRVAGALKQQLVVPSDITVKVRRLAARIGLPGYEGEGVKVDPDLADLDEGLKELLQKVINTAKRLEPRNDDAQPARKSLLSQLAELRQESGTTSIFGEVAGIEQSALTVDEDRRVKLRGLKQSLLRRIDEIGKTLPPNAKARLKSVVWSPNAPAADKKGPVAWSTSVHVEPEGATTVSSWIEFGGVSPAQWNRLAHLNDPRNWKVASIFWLMSDALDETPKLAWTPDGKSDPPDDPPAEWNGRLLEQVSAAAIFEATLRVNFAVADNQWTVTYSLVRSPDGLTTDEGYVTATIAGDRIRCEVLKRVDFRNGPYGAPSAMDTLAPSYIGSWLRVQQDLWAAHVVGKDFPPAMAKP